MEKARSFHPRPDYLALAPVFQQIQMTVSPEFDKTAEVEMRLQFYHLRIFRDADFEVGKFFLYFIPVTDLAHCPVGPGSIE